MVFGFNIADVAIIPRMSTATSAVSVSAINLMSGSHTAPNGVGDSHHKFELAGLVVFCQFIALFG